MNRKLKFRVWSFLSKSFEYFDIYQGADLGIAGGVSEPQQFTGMLDKNGKEIYEGDIVKRRDDKLYFEVVYSDNEAAYLLKDQERDSAYLPDFDVEVIGNIFENKDLICDHTKYHMSVNGNCYNCGKLIFPKK